MLALLAVAALSCAGRGDGLVVGVEAHVLLVCERGVELQRHRVALGSGGSGKRREGDEKTPLGEYALGAPRPSAQFGTFVPVGYPTPAQRRLGFTGGAVGVHGPLRSARWLGRANVAVDWTLGCIAVESDEAIGRVARWLRAHPRAMIHLE